MLLTCNARSSGTVVWPSGHRWWAFVVALLLLGATSALRAEDVGSEQPVSVITDGLSAIEPEVVITPHDDKRIREYRVNGMLYMIEVIPGKGPPYYLVDMDGDGAMETRRDLVEHDVLIPRWTLFRWK